MSDLPGFSDHCRKMAAARHKPECHALIPHRWYDKTVHPDPACPGCLSDAERALFTQLAGEVDRYLAGELAEPITTDEDAPLWEDA